MFSIIFDLGSFRIVDFYRLLANPFALLYQWSPPGGVDTALSLRCFPWSTDSLSITMDPVLPVSKRLNGGYCVSYPSG